MSANELRAHLVLFWASFAALSLSIAAPSCSPASGEGGVRAIPIPGPAGVDCYAIMDGEKTVGGSCLAK